MTADRPEFRHVRRFPRNFIAMNAAAALFALSPGVRDLYIAWNRDQWPERTADVSDNQITLSLDQARRALLEILSDVDGEPPEVLVPRRIRFGAGEGQPVITLTEDPAATAGVSIPGEDGGVTSVAWVISRRNAEQLIAAFRSQAGEPDVEAMADAPGSEAMADSFFEHAVHVHPD